MATKVQQEKEDRETTELVLRKHREELETECLTQEVFSGELMSTSAPVVVV